MYTLQTPTPAGILTAIVDDDHTVRAAGFTDDGEVMARRLTLQAAPAPRSDGPVADAVARYLAGEVAVLAHVRTEQPGTAFQQLVWSALCDVEPGRPASYADLAIRIGRPGATRAVGTACGRNQVAPFVPCHRAVRADGTAGGYLYGPDVKAWLLAHESGHR